MGIASVLIALLVFTTSARAENNAFRQWLQTLWPQARVLGVSRAVFNEATRGLEPDFSLPDLLVPGRPPPAQPEFIQTPAQYLREATLNRLAVRGRHLAEQYRNTLARIEHVFGVSSNIVLAIWARETNYGRVRLSHDAIRVLATQGFIGERKGFFRDEFLHALKMLQDGVRRTDMRSSWGGAMGLMQFLPSDYEKYAVDFDGDGRADIWHSVPDALASAANELKAKGWQRGEPWAIEVRAPADADCTIAEPHYLLPIGAWVRRGFMPVHSRRFGRGALDLKASLLLPEGSYGPAFLTPKNYYVLKDYNYSDLYVLFVGHLSDLIGGGRPFATPWAKNKQLQTKEVVAMQRRLTALGLYRDKIDGKAGMLTRAALGAYQKANGLKVDCWPTAAVLDHMRR